MARKYPSYCCQKCGEMNGWLGRFLTFICPWLFPCSGCEREKTIKIAKALSIKDEDE